MVLLVNPSVCVFAMSPILTYEKIKSVNLEQNESKFPVDHETLKNFTDEFPNNSVDVVL